MPKMCSEILYIDFEAQNDLKTILQGVVLNLLVADQLQHDVTDINRSY